MTLGYDSPRPKKENYENFEKKIIAGLEELKIPGISLMVYGSYARQTYIPGRSDIDGVLIFNNEIVIDKDHLKSVSNLVKDSQIGNNVPLQFTVSDKYNMQHGNFNSYDRSYHEAFKQEGKIWHGEDYRKEFNYSKNELRQHAAMKFNLRKSRTNFLMSEHNAQTNYSKFIESFGKSLDSMSNLSRQILALHPFIKPDREKYNYISLIQKAYPNVNVEPLEVIKYYNNNLDKLDELYKNKEEVSKVWVNGLDCVEQILKAYINPDFQRGVHEFNKRMAEESKFPTKGLILTPHKDRIFPSENDIVLSASNSTEL